MRASAGISDVVAAAPGKSTRTHPACRDRWLALVDETVAKILRRRTTSTSESRVCKRPSARRRKRAPHCLRIVNRGYRSVRARAQSKIPPNLQPPRTTSSPRCARTLKNLSPSFGMKLQHCRLHHGCKQSFQRHSTSDSGILFVLADHQTCGMH